MSVAVLTSSQTKSLVRAGLISLEPWDQVWRRNQHLAAQLVGQGLISELLFVEPPAFGRGPWVSRPVQPGITAVRPVLRLPKRAGGLALLGGTLRRRLLGQIDVLWINDPVLGVHCLQPKLPAVHDVTDDWREFNAPGRIRRRLVRAEDRLATRASTVVCSDVLRQRWADRYGVDAKVIHNGVDTAAWSAVVPQLLEGAPPHVGYIGTLHEERLDVSLLASLARCPDVGTLHLVGPDVLAPKARARLVAEAKVRFTPAVHTDQVPAWTTAMDLLVSPHAVTPFTLSLDAIKSYEYMASGRPVVATPTSGFQHLTEWGVTLAEPADFVGAVGDALRARARTEARDPQALDWALRAQEFAAQLAATSVGASVPVPGS